MNTITNMDVTVRMQPSHWPICIDEADLPSAGSSVACHAERIEGRAIAPVRSEQPG